VKSMVRDADNSTNKDLCSANYRKKSSRGEGCGFAHDVVVDVTHDASLATSLD
jgi:hypothetical protein